MTSDSELCQGGLRTQDENSLADIRPAVQVRIIPHAPDPWVGHEGSVVWIGGQQLVSDVRFSDPMCAPPSLAISEVEIIDHPPSSEFIASLQIRPSG
jgi:hypothetical protein